MRHLQATVSAFQENRITGAAGYARSTAWGSSQTATITYAYDSLNRLTDKTYSDSTQNSSWFVLKLSVAFCASALQEPVRITFGPFAEPQAIASPDGRWLVFEYFHKECPETPELWIMPISGGFAQARPLVDDENYHAEPSWSPDSQWVSYQQIATIDHSDSIQLFKINVYSGQKIQLTHLKTAKGMIPGDSTSWSMDGRIVFEMKGDIYQVGEEGREVTKLLDIHSRYESIEPSLIRWSPDETRLCFVAKEFSKPDEIMIWLYDFKTREMRSLTAGTFPWWLDNDHILLSRIVSEEEIRIMVFSVTGGEPSVITKGHLDVAPSTARGGSLIFFGRGLRSRPVTNNLNIFGGFRIWKTALRRYAGKKPREPKSQCWTGETIIKE